MNWFPLGLLCAFSLASADALTKKYFSDATGLQLTVLRLAAPGILLLPLTFIYPLPPVPPFFWVLIVILVPFELLAMWLYMLAIRDNPLHLTVPYLAFTPVFNILTGMVILGETISLAGFLGILLVVTGAWFLNIESIRFHDWKASFTAILRIRGPRLMLSVALIYSFTSVLGKLAMQYATPESFGPFYFTLLGMVAIGVVLLHKPGSTMLLVRRWQPMLVVGGCMAVMIITHFRAIAEVEVAYFIAVKRSSLIFGILYGYLLFKEENLFRHFLAGALMVSGVALIVAG
ncbi:MAG: EamA family transporter [Desulfobulbaceae bacterium]|nr:EamA family transporter [Desulfobulbaceae bacterium]